MKQTTTQFDFSAKPKVTATKPKYRQRDQQRIQGTSLMNDPRIIRGNTYAAIIANKNQIHPPPQIKKQVKQSPNKMKDRRINFDTGFEPTTPRAVTGRDHFTTQTQPFVQTLRDKPIQYEKQSQTDLFLDRPVQRLFNPMDGKTGTDKTTQIQENDPDLFNFDYEVQPILDAILNKVLETSRMQLYEEEQLRLKQKQKQQYEKRRHARLVQAQKLEANQERLKDEYERRQLQYRKSTQQECFAQKKILGRILSKQYLKNLRQNTQLVLQHQGFFRHPLQIDLYQTYVPWLYDQIKNELEKKQQFNKFTEQMAQQAERQQINQAQIPITKQKQRIKSIERQIYEKKQARIARKKQKLQEEERKRKEAEQQQQRKRLQAQNAENQDKKEPQQND